MRAISTMWNCVAPLGVPVLVGLFVCGLVGDTLAAKNECPDEYQQIPFARLAAELKQFAGCKVDVEVMVATTIDQRTRKYYQKLMPKKYKEHALVQVVSPTAGAMGLAVMPDEQRDLAYSLQIQENVRIKGIVDESSAKPGTWNEFRPPGSQRSELVVIDVHELDRLGGSPLAPPEDTGASGLAQKLKELKALKDQGLITDEDYEKKKKELLDGM